MIPFNVPYRGSKELEYVRRAIEGGALCGDGPFTRRCQEWLEQRLGCGGAFLTHSCTAALEMAAILADIKPGDEVILPSFTFVSTVNAFVLRGAVPVFVDIRPDTLNIDETKIEEAVSPRTRAIVPVHYAGVACEMDRIMEIARSRGLLVIEDAAQAILATYKGRHLGTLGHLGALSFHESKNIISGEGGALLVNDPRFRDRAEVIREKGTDRSRFFRGEVDKYTWQDIGSSYLPSELVSAFLLAQLEQADELTARRLAVWQRYHDALLPSERAQTIRRPVVPAGCGHNGHLYYTLFPDGRSRDLFLDEARKRGAWPTFHYIALHDSPAGRRYGRTSGSLAITEEVSRRLARLPLWIGIENRMDEVLPLISESIRVATSGG